MVNGFGCSVVKEFKNIVNLIITLHSIVETGLLLTYSVNIFLRFNVIIKKFTQVYNTRFISSAINFFMMSICGLELLF